MNIAHQRKSIAVLVHEVSFEAALEQVSHPFQPRIDVAGVAEGEVLHACGQGLIPGLEGQVQVIGHEAKGVHAVAEARRALSYEFVELVSILRGKEDVLPGVAAQDNVVEAARNVEAGFAGHRTA